MSKKKKDSKDRFEDIVPEEVLGAYERNLREQNAFNDSEMYDELLKMTLSSLNIDPLRADWDNLPKDINDLVSELMELRSVSRFHQRLEP